VVFVQRGKTSDDPLQVLHREIFGQMVDIFSPGVHPKRVFASLQWLHSNSKEVRDYLNTRKFFSIGVLELMDASHQGFSGRSFFGSRLRVPASAPLNLFGSFKRRDTVLLGEGRLILDVQPFLAPPLDGVREFNIEIINIGANADANFRRETIKTFGWQKSFN
jgi:hypothetical protein